MGDNCETKIKANTHWSFADWVLIILDFLFINDNHANGNNTIRELQLER
jgi:hypothetical protein